jgi:molybdenum cofactor cytidylyltransferase
MISRGTLAPEIVVLAAGSSIRLGRNKALARIHGISLLGIQLAKLSPLARRKVSVVVPRRSAARREAIRHGGRCIVNAHPEGGMSNSVRCAMKSLRNSHAVMILPVDLIGIKPADIERMIATWRGHRRKLVARRLGTRGVTPAILPKHLFRLGEKLRGDVGLRDLIADLPAGERVLVRMPSAQVDVDTPSDLAAARRRFPRAPGFYRSGT